jgi:hypothetical protein
MGPRARRCRSRPDTARARAWRRPLGDRGFVTAWTVALAGTCWLLVGLVYDSGRVLRDRSEAFGAAASAARAGAQEIDQRALLTDGTIQLDQEQAVSTAMEYLNARGFDGTATVLGDLEVMVTVNETADLHIIPVPDSITFEVSATAEAIEEGG